jgi:hypothetical protein
MGSFGTVPRIAYTRLRTTYQYEDILKKKGCYGPLGAW